MKLGAPAPWEGTARGLAVECIPVRGGGQGGKG